MKKCPRFLRFLAIAFLLLFIFVMCYTLNSILDRKINDSKNEVVESVNEMNEKNNSSEEPTEQ